MNVTATRYLRAQAELAVAHEIHRVLVPSIDRTAGEDEFFGWSIASGEVGGDLVDLVDADGRWLAYVADVSGHGVGAGIVMGMFKSALRTRALADGSVAAVLGDIQTALMPLKQPNMYVTVACVRGGAGATSNARSRGITPSCGCAPAWWKRSRRHNSPSACSRMRHSRRHASSVAAVMCSCC